MSDNTEKPNEVEKKPNEAENKAGTELLNEDLATATGGWGDIKGGSTDDRHKDWSE
jgi:hypothetical protein